MVLKEIDVKKCPMLPEYFGTKMKQMIQMIHFVSL